MNAITRFHKGSAEYDRLAKVAALLTANSAKGYTYTVEDTYFDFGQDWWWTTIIAHDPSRDGFLGHWQALCPRDQETALTASTALEAVNAIVADEYWRDK